MTVHPGSFCKLGNTGVTAKGTPMECSPKEPGQRARWRRAAVPTGDNAPMPEPQPTVDATPPQSLPERIRSAYRTLAGDGDPWVPFAQLRPLLADLDQADVDVALVAMYRADDQVAIIPSSVQGDLTAADRDAAVRIGAHACHLISIRG